MKRQRLPTRLFRAKAAYRLAVLAFAFGLIAIWVFDLYRARAFERKATGLKLGMTRGEVLATLGRPTAEFPIGTMFWNPSNPATWAYGRKLELKNSLSREPPFFWPVRLRLQPYPDDLVLEFDDFNRLSRVKLPLHVRKGEITQ